jgi:hypothetical protein
MVTLSLLLLRCVHIQLSGLLLFLSYTLSYTLSSTLSHTLSYSIVHIKVSGLLLSLFGLIAIIVTVDKNNFGEHLWQRPDDPTSSGFSDAKTHGTLGLTIMVVGFQQPLLAMLRPHPPKDGERKESGRLMWEVAHKSLGYGALLLAICQIYGGFDVLRALQRCDTTAGEGSR